MSELVTAHDPEKPETAYKEITRVVILPNSKKLSKLGTEAQFHKPRRTRHDEVRQGRRRQRRSARVSLSSSLTLGDSRTPHYIYWCNSPQTRQVGLNFGAIPC
jgi:hypothetical protein